MIRTADLSVLFLDGGPVFITRETVETPQALEEQWEADRVYAFCEHGMGHANIQVEGPDESVGIFGTHVYCGDCDIDLSNDELLNPVDRSI